MTSVIRHFLSPKTVISQMVDFKNLLKIELLCLEFFCSNPSHSKKIVRFQYLGTYLKYRNKYLMYQK